MGTKDDIIADLRQLVERQAKQIDVLTNEVDDVMEYEICNEDIKR